MEFCAQYARARLGFICIYLTTLKRTRIAIYSIRILLNDFRLMNTMFCHHLRLKRIQYCEYVHCRGNYTEIPVSSKE